MRKTALISAVANEAPNSSTLTTYDEEHLLTYLRLLDAQAEGADWDEAALLVLQIDPVREPRPSTPYLGEPCRTCDMAGRARIRSPVAMACRTDLPKSAS